MLPQPLPRRCNAPGVVDWLTFPQQRLRTITDGRIFYDGLGKLIALQNKFRYYPQDIWLYLLAVQWGRISQEEPFVGRCGQVDDDVGSALVAARLVRDKMNLCFLLERQYAPYMKWFGTAFSQLNCADKLMPIPASVLRASCWQEREQYLSLAYEIVAAMTTIWVLLIPCPRKCPHSTNGPFSLFTVMFSPMSFGPSLSTRKSVFCPKTWARLINLLTLRMCCLARSSFLNSNQYTEKEDNELSICRSKWNSVALSSERRSAGCGLFMFEHVALRELA